MLCFTEHHMNYLELQQTYTDRYNLDACYCRTFFKKGGIRSYVRKSLKFCKHNVEKYCKEKELEFCVLKLSKFQDCMYSLICRAPLGCFNLFVTKLDTVLRNLYNSTLEYIICSDVNLSGPIDSERKSQLEALLRT
jgi:hypothetical protein